MYKIIGADQQEYGPSTADELRQWVREGRADGRSLVKAEGTTEWKPLATFPELAVALAESPFHAQRPAAPPPLSGPADPGVVSAQVLAASPDLRISDCLGGGWQLLKGNFGLLFFATISVALIQVFLSRLPLIRILGALLAGVFQGGIYLMFIKRLRGQPATLGDAYSGFGEHFVQLLLVGIVSAILTALGLFCCLILPGIYLMVAWQFAVPLVVDKELQFWDALELSRKIVTRYWFQIFLLLFVVFLPGILYAIGLRIATLGFAYSQYQAGQIDPSLFTTDRAAYTLQLQHLESKVADKFFVWMIIEQFIFALLLPFARAALVQAYEILFNPRPAPPA